MSVRLYDSGTRTTRVFVPRQPGTVSIYLCGATVYGPPHLGHLRGAVAFDILQRWLASRGYRVTFIRNVTDIDDKILRAASEADCPWWGLAGRHERQFGDAYRALGCLPPTYEPRATGHITDMIALTQRLVDRGHAYPAGGDMVFSVSSFPDYGALSGQDPRAVRPAEDRPRCSRDPRDFALWKAAKPGEPATAAWPTPWGRVRPGWHLECAAMSTRYLGTVFDIHGGGHDLIFPHHENERAQAQAAGYAFARYWLHNGLVTVDGTKMSQSLGNPLRLTPLLERWRPIELRYYLCTAHYRSPLEFSPAAIDEAAAAYRRIEHFTATMRAALGDDGSRVDERDESLPDEFIAAMDDDLGVPSALAAIQTEVRRGNAALADGAIETASAALRATLRMTEVLGLGPGAAEPARTERLESAFQELMGLALEQRAAARTRRDFTEADAIRARLANVGVTLEDTPRGQRWEFQGTRRDHPAPKPEP